MRTKVEIFSEIATLTKEHCDKTCIRMGSCCEALYCHIAIEEAAEDGVVLEVQDGPLPLMKDGQCLAQPHHRVLCSLHQCDISGVGVFRGDTERTIKYFKLRQEAEEAEEGTL